jgi:hypothetical protein
MAAIRSASLARVVALGAVLVCGARAAEAFVVLRPLSQDLESAVRWSAVPHEATGGAGLHDGIQVAIEPELAEAIAIAVTGEALPEDAADLDAAVAAAFVAWESSVLRFTVEFDGPAERDPTAGAEIDVFAVPESDPVFQDNNFFGRTDSTFVLVDDRVLTNADVLAGFAFTGADIYLNLDMLAAAATVLDRDQQLAALRRLVMHEIGHALGFHHPNEFVEQNYDTDTDPLNVMVIDPRDPLADLMLSPMVDVNAVVSNQPVTLEALLRTTLTNDDRGGRDALYPGPPATTCAADCDASGIVSIAELLRAVNVARGSAFFLACPAADRNRDLSVTVAELVAGVRAALQGCSASL